PDLGGLRGPGYRPRNRDPFTLGSGKGPPRSVSPFLSSSPVRVPHRHAPDQPAGVPAGLAGDAFPRPPACPPHPQPAEKGQGRTSGRPGKRLSMTICYWGTYDRDYPRNRVLINGLKASGAEVTECHFPLWGGTAEKLHLARSGWLRPGLILRGVWGYTR